MSSPYPFLLPEWPAPPRVHAIVTTRKPGVSLPPYAGLNLATHVGDDPLAVDANRRWLRGFLPTEPAWLEQVHGVAVHCADEETAQCPQADAAVATRKKRVCVVMTADCLPVLFTDRAATVVAAAHAGWRGLQAGVLEATLTRMGVDPADILAWLGPAIGPEAFEVGDDVRQAFVGDHPDSARAFRAGRQEGKYWCDLYALARQRLWRAGVTAVHGGGLCTYGDGERFYSYRRTPMTGRMASLIWLD